MPETSKAGYIGEVARNTATHATPTWVTLPRIKDAAFTIEPEQLDDSSRGSGWKKSQAGLIEAGFTFSFNYKAGDTNHDYLIAAIVARTVFEVYAADGPVATSGSEGLRAYIQLFSYNMNQPISDGMTIDCTAMPAYFEEAAAEVDPDWYVAP